METTLYYIFSTKEDEVVRSLENESSSQGLHSISHTVKVKKSDEKVDFNGIQVSHQQYSRLVKLQEKVLTMNKVIQFFEESCVFESFKISLPNVNTQETFFYN